jgi:hypothetical protein
MTELTGDDLRDHDVRGEQQHHEDREVEGERHPLARGGESDLRSHKCLLAFYPGTRAPVPVLLDARGPGGAGMRLARFFQRRIAEAYREAATHHDSRTCGGRHRSLDLQAGPELRPGDAQRRSTARPPCRPAAGMSLIPKTPPLASS